jgi:hypothetical protein
MAGSSWRFRDQHPPRPGRTGAAECPFADQYITPKDFMKNEPNKLSQLPPDIYMSLPGMKAGKATGQLVATVFSNSAISYAERCEFAKTAATKIDDICASMEANGVSDDCIGSYRKWYAKGYSTAFDKRVYPVSKEH